MSYFLKMFILFIGITIIFEFFYLNYLTYQNKVLQDAYKSIYRENKGILHNRKRILELEGNLIYSLIIDSGIKDFIYEFSKTNNDVYKELIKTNIDMYKNVLLKYYISDIKVLLRYKSIYQMNKKGLKNYYSIGFYSKPFSTFVINKGKIDFQVSIPIFYKGRLIGNFVIFYDFLKAVREFFKDRDLYVILFEKYGKYTFTFVKVGDVYMEPLFYKKFGAFALHFKEGVLVTKPYLFLVYPVYQMGDKIGYLVKVVSVEKFKKVYNIENDDLEYILWMLYFLSLLIAIGIMSYLRVYKKAYYDKLTQVLNRFGCYKKIKNLDKYVILLFDIDYFKRINDKYGHDIGDEVLAEFAKILKNSVRKSDIICRWGGEEFVIILPNTSFDNGIKIAERIRKSVEHHRLFPRGLRVTVSIGVHYSEKGFDFDLKTADNKLYEAKKRGRNRVVY